MGSSRSFGSERPNAVHLVRNGKGGVAGEVGDLRSDVDDAFVSLEAAIDAVGIPKPVKYATAAALAACTAAGAGTGKTLTADANGALSVDGAAPAASDRILVKDQVADEDNGIYVVTAPGTAGTPWVLTRATDFDGAAEVVSQTLIRVEQGTANSDTIWQLTTHNPIVVDTTSLAFARIQPYTHASTHTDATDEIDGDQLDVDMTPTHYTPDAGVPEASDVDDLSAHLGGIDNELGTLHERTGAPDIRALRVAGGTLSADGSEDFTLLGNNLIQGQSFSTLTLGASLVITAEEPGVGGDALSVEIVDSGGIGGLAVTYAAGTLTIDLDGAVPDEDTIAAAINAGAAAWTGILRADSGGGAAFGTVAETNLAGGSGSGLSIVSGGGACTLVGESGGLATSTASATETQIEVDPPDMTGLTPALQAADATVVELVSNGKASNSVSIVLV